MLISDYDISEFIREDVPYIDLTTKLLGIENKYGKMTLQHGKTRCYQVLRKY